MLYMSWLLQPVKVPFLNTASPTACDTNSAPLCLCREKRDGGSTGFRIEDCGLTCRRKQACRASHKQTLGLINVIIPSKDLCAFKYILHVICCVYGEKFCINSLFKCVALTQHLRVCIILVECAFFIH